MVRDAEGGPVSGGTALLRLLATGHQVVFYIGFIGIFVDKRRRGWHDLIAGTVVIEQYRGCVLEPAQRLAAHGLALPGPHARLARRRAGAARRARRPQRVRVADSCSTTRSRTAWDHLFSDFAGFQLCLFDPAGELGAASTRAPRLGRHGHGLPEGWDDHSSVCR